MTEIIRVRAPGGADQLELATIDLPVPAADEVRIRHTAIGVNSIDLYHRMGLYRCLPPLSRVSRRPVWSLPSAQM